VFKTETVIAFSAKSGSGRDELWRTIEKSLGDF